MRENQPNIAYYFLRVLELLFGQMPNLKQLFDIEDLASKHVDDLVDAHCQLAYRCWRNTLARAYKKAIDAGTNPGFKSPMLEVTHAKWQKVCDHLESEEFKERSKKNVENMAKLKYNHTTGKISYLTKYKEMSEPCKIELWRSTHMTKSGDFVNEEAKTLHDAMMELKNKPLADGEVSLSDDVILEYILGHRSGYQKGMGSGVEVSKRSESSTASTLAQKDLEMKRLKMDLDAQKLENENLKIEIERLKAAQEEERLTQQAREEEQNQRIDFLFSKLGSTS